MEWLQSLLDSSTTPVLTAFLLGIMTAICPCPLATNIAAIGYISKGLESRRRVFLNGVLYTLGRVLAYSLLGAILIAVIRGGASMFGIQKFVGMWGEFLLGPVLVVMGAFMLFGHKLNLPKIGMIGNAEKVANGGSWGALLLGILFAVAFCPSSGMFYFGMLIPMSATATAGYFLPVVYAVATALPVLLVAWTLAFSASKVGNLYGKMQIVERWVSIIVGIIFIVIGIYYIILIYF